MNQPIDSITNFVLYEEELYCPNCGYPQFCPCDYCACRLPPDHVPWIWHRGRLVECGCCGFMRDVDWWVNYEMTVKSVWGY
jgi:hypothetical protein